MSAAIERGSDQRRIRRVDFREQRGTSGFHLRAGFGLPGGWRALQLLQHSMA